jgi:O-methyltransferase
LYPKLSPGGYCIIDDYYPWPDCAKAVNEYRQEHGISEEMHDIDQTGVYWRKGTRKGEPR